MVGVKINHQGVSALARETGYAIATVSKKLSKGLSPDDIRRDARRAGIKPMVPILDPKAKMTVGSKAGRAAVAAAAKADDENEDEDGGGPEPSRGRPTGKPENFYEAQARKERVLADLRELEYRQKSGELVPIGEVNAWFSSQIVRARSILLTIGPELRDALADEVDPIKCDEMVTAEIERALNELAEYGRGKSKAKSEKSEKDKSDKSETEG